MQTKTLNLSIGLAIIALLMGFTQPAIAANPSNIELDYNKTGTGLSTGTHIGSIQVKPQDSSNYQFELVSGSGSKHNPLFQIQNQSLLTDQVIQNAGKKSVRIKAASNNDTIEEVIEVKVEHNFYPKLVNKNFTKSGAMADTISVPDSAAITSMALMLQMNHTNIDSIWAHLTHQQTNTTITLIKTLSTTGNCGYDSMLVTLKPDAKTTLTPQCPPIYDTTYQSIMGLNTFVKENLNGKWILDVNIPTLYGDSGKLKKWAVNFQNTSSSSQDSIQLTNQTIIMQDSIGDLVGKLQLVGSDMNSNVTFNLISGKGDTHNNLFKIKKDALYVDSTLSEGKKQIRIQADDGNDTIANTLSIRVDDTSNNTNSYTFDTSNVASIHDYMAKREYLISYRDDDSIYTDTTITSTDTSRDPSSKKSESTLTSIEKSDQKMEFTAFYPNPFTQTTSLKYSLKKRSTISLRIFNMEGELIKHIKRKKQGPGNHRLQWNGKNRKGQMAKKGTFLYSLEIIDQKGTLVNQRSGKIVRLK